MASQATAATLQCKSAVQILICPGIHPPQLTTQFRAAFPDQLSDALVFPAAASSAYAGWEILRFLFTQLSQNNASQALRTPLLLIGFSAGVVGAASLASLWQGLGGSVVALIALDGWGVPLGPCFPVHRLSHDPFTHWSSALLGAGQANFFASPAVDHLELWRSPQRVEGWGQFNDPKTGPKTGQTPSQTPYSRGTAAQFISQWLAAYHNP
jgi:hypothetical protein